ncbi:histidine kinase [Fibrella sp. HMF5335]|uniref:histidine kinase n=1 Tax=Fibrella rubiginis TaxID=2817060 RepID=A0A939GDJ1_9BACT|nr:sensor histidine kinase [Fibrella rubiginis]MBO0935788.1 histidine kinase [Fibrella rubiginis]
MSSLTLIICSLCYLSTLFLIANWAESRSRRGRSSVNNPYVYALSMAVYCTAWTFYGSVSKATTDGIDFLAVYIGPTLSAPLWWLVTRKIIRICKVQRITSIADFISARYGKNRGLGVLVTLFCVVGIIPYISIQIKAIAGSFALLTNQSGTVSSPTFLSDRAFYVTLLLAIFAILFGTRKFEATERHEGMVTAIAFESIIKLVSFVAVGAYITFGLFNGPTDIFARAARLPALSQNFGFDSVHSSGDWFWHCLLGGLAILFLPRQFQVAVVENVDEKHLNKAMWLFPLYLLLINLFVLPLAFGGALLLGTGANADGFLITLPLQHGQHGLALLAYIGGFSAATSMIIVETTALSVMISNNVVMPLFLARPRWRERYGASMSGFVINVRRLAMLGLLCLAYVYYRQVANRLSLVSVGMISFAAVAQFAPAMLGGIFWKRGTQQGARLGLLAGGAVWFYTLIIPTLVPMLLPASLLTDGPFGIGWLNPQALMGLTTYDAIAHSMFWSMVANVGGYVWGSLGQPQSALDHNQAVLFVDVFTYAKTDDSSVVWKGKALLADLQRLLTTFFGAPQANRLLERYGRRNPQVATLPYAPPQLVANAERLLAGAVGAASARILVSSVAEEEPIAIDEVIRILKTSQELKQVNKELTRKSTELQHLTERLSEANHKLQMADQQKDDFLATITHEIRSPITSIRALSEILFDDDTVDHDTRRQFLGTMIKESERLSRLVNQVLDLERIESGKQKLSLTPLTISSLIRDAVDSVTPLATAKYISINVQTNCRELTVLADADWLMQVMINLISNAIKFSTNGAAPILLEATCQTDICVVSVTDQGIGIDPQFHELIFEKFYQTRLAHNYTPATDLRKPIGSGLGLAISKRIIDLHGGNLSVSSQPGIGSTFTFQLPLLNTT